MKTHTSVDFAVILGADTFAGRLGSTKRLGLELWDVEPAESWENGPGKSNSPVRRVGPASLWYGVVPADREPCMCERAVPALVRVRDFVAKTYFW